MTEDEAKTKWCPFVRRQFDYQTVAVNRTARVGQTDELPHQALCIGSECMAWRKFTTLQINARHDEDEWMGYCGLAGKPFKP